MKVFRRRGTALSALAVGCALIAPAAASAQSSGVLSPELAKLATPAVRAQSPVAQAETLGLPTSGTGSLERRGEGVTVEISFSEGALAALPALREAGAEIADSSDAYQLVTAVVPPADLPAIAGVSGVTSVNAVRQPIFSAVEKPNFAVEAKATCEGGTVLTEGLDQLGVVTQPNKVGAREAFGVRGAGETVGVLSDSYDTGNTIVTFNPEEGVEEFETIPTPTHAAEDIQSNNLPGLENTCSGQQVPVKVIQEGTAPPQGDEGRAMLQVVHDIAPHANLAFATAAGGELNFAQNIERLAAPVSAGGAGANVIVDDVTYPEEPMFQDGPIAAAIAKVRAAGVTYVTAAGNNNIETSTHAEVGSWETPAFTDTENPAYCPIPVGVAARHCLNFAPSGKPENDKFAITIEKGKPVDIAVGWSEPWYGVKADLDVYLLHYVNPKKAFTPGETEVAAVDNGANVNGKPAAYVEWENPEAPEQKHETEEVFLVINRCFGNVCDQEADPAAKPRVKVVFLAHIFPNPIIKTQYEESEGGNIVGPTVFGHAGAAAAITAGATRFTTDEKTINTVGTPERFSSRGPVTHYWGPVTSTTPAAALGAPEVVEKPNVVATDCNATTFFTRFFLSFWRFCGTSAAAPHVAGIAALMRQASPSTSPAGFGSAIASTAKPVPGYSNNSVGKGLVQARQAIEALSNRVAVNDPPSTVVPPVTPVVPPEEPEKVNPPAPAPTPIQAGGAESKSNSGGSNEKAIRVVPTTTIKSHPAKLVKSRVGRPKLQFKFASDQKGAKFECSTDGSKWAVCAANYKAFFTLGAHELQVRARGTNGAVDKTPAVFKFKVKLVA